MKKLLIITTVLFAAFTANAKTILNPETFLRVAELTKINLDKTLFPENKVIKATVSVNPVTRLASLNIKSIRPMCPKPKPGFVTCMAIGNRVVEENIELPIVSVTQENCGATIYKAERDARPVDGNLETLKIVDLTTLTCKIAIPADRLTQVVYSVTTAGFGGPVLKLKSKATGKALKSPFIDPTFEGTDVLPVDPQSLFDSNITSSFAN